MKWLDGIQWIPWCSNWRNKRCKENVAGFSRTYVTIRGVLLCGGLVLVVNNEVRLSSESIVYQYDV